MKLSLAAAAKEKPICSGKVCEDRVPVSERNMACCVCGTAGAELHALTLVDHTFGQLQQERESERPLPPRLRNSLKTALKKT